jgi:rhamnosyltransferase
MSSAGGVPSIVAVVVTYRPDGEGFDRLIAAVMPQVTAIIVVDNDGGRGLPDGLEARIAESGGKVIRQPKNLGLAEAQNIGLEWAREHGATHALLFDQDSIPAADMAAKLLEALETLSLDGPVAAVGPRFHDDRENRDAPFVRIGFPFNRKLSCRVGEPAIECDFLISSGTLVPLKVLDKVGGMDDSLFIDSVDLDWSFRARSMGYSLYGVCAATMHHRLGDSRKALPLGLGAIVVHSPVRLYYMMRNRVRLYRRRHVPTVWKLQDLPRLFVKLFLFSVVAGPRWTNLRYMGKGIVDGVNDRGGACPIKSPPG